MLAKTRTLASAESGRLLRLRFTMFLTFACLVLACVIASKAVQGADAGKSPQLSGDYYVMPLGPYQDAAKVRELESTMRMCWIDQNVTENSDNFKKFSEYYKSYVPRKFSQPDAGAEVNDIIYDTLRGLESTARGGSPTMKQQAPAMIRDVMVTIASRDINGKFFNPAARINAALLLGNLNAVPSINGAPPKPDTNTNVVGTLAKLYRSAEVPAGVRLMALMGLRRQAVLLGTAAPGSFKGFLLAQGKDLLSGKGPEGLTPADLPKDVFAFVQRYAIDIVAAVGSAEDKKWLVEELNKLVADQDSSPIVANAAAKRIGLLTEQLKEASVGEQTLVSWAEKTHQVLTSEIERLNSLAPLAVVIPQISLLQGQGAAGGAGGMGGMGGMGMGGGRGGMGMGMGGSEGGYPGGSGMGGDDDDEYGSGAGGYPGGGTGGMGMGGMDGSGMGGMGMGGMDGSGLGGYGGMGGYGASGAKQTPELIASRRIVNAHLEAHLMGMAGSIDTTKPAGGMLVAAKDKAKTLADELAASLVTITEEVNKKTNSAKPRYLMVLQEQAKTLKKWIDRNKVVAEPEEPAPPTDLDSGSDQAGS